jgi:hypothetical protein
MAEAGSPISRVSSQAHAASQTLFGVSLILNVNVKNSAVSGLHSFLSSSKVARKTGIKKLLKWYR